MILMMNVRQSSMIRARQAFGMVVKGAAMMRAQVGADVAIIGENLAQYVIVDAVKSVVTGGIAVANGSGISETRINGDARVSRRPLIPQASMEKSQPSCPKKIG